MGDAEPFVEQVFDGEEARLTLRGDWVARHTMRLEALVANPPRRVRAVTIDIAPIERLDTFGAWAIESMRRDASAAGAVAAIEGADPARAAILSQLQKASFSQTASARPGIADQLESLGRLTVSGAVYLVASISLLGRLALGFLAGFRRPKLFRAKSVIYHLDRTAVRAAPIIMLITFLIGSIIAQQGLFYFRKFGATDYVVNLVAVLVLRELGVLLVAIMLAGRSGSAYAAEIGSMKMREEIDALRTMGLDPAALLSLPRVIALVVAAPLLTILGVLSALYGAGLVMWFYGGMAPAIYLTRLQSAATFSDLEVGMIKAPVMALVIGVVAALEGFAVQGSSESLGLKTTASVVKSIFLVIVLDGLFAVLFTALGM